MPTEKKHKPTVGGLFSGVGGIELGFKQIMTIEKENGMKKINNSFLEIARQDHAEIFKRMN